MGSNDDRPRRSWAEIDKLRDGTGRREPRGQSRRNKAEEAQKTDEALKSADSLFTAEKGGIFYEATWNPITRPGCGNTTSS